MIKKIMKTKELLGMLLLFLSAINFASCSDDDELSPITLEYEDSNVIFDNEIHTFNLTPFSGETTPLHIKGGDGNYKITNSDESVVRVNFDGTKISLQAQSLGNAFVKIEDAANNSYTLSVIIKYREFANAIVQRKYIITGDGLTVGDKTKLENEIKATDFTDKYLFTYKDAENSIGSVCVWNKDNKTKEYNFTNELIKLSEENAILIAGEYKLHEYNKVTIQGENYSEVLYVTRSFFSLIGTRMNNFPNPTYCYIKDLTEQYKSVYPKAEHIYIIYEVMSTLKL